MSVSYLVKVVDWSDDAYKEYGTSNVVVEFVTESLPGFSYDGGRLDVTGHPDTIYVSSHQFSVRVEKI